MITSRAHRIEIKALHLLRRPLFTPLARLHRGRKRMLQITTFAREKDEDGKASNAESFQSKLIKFAKAMNVTDPADLVEMRSSTFGSSNSKERGGRSGKSTSDAKRQVRADEERVLSFWNSSEFTKIGLGITVALLLLYLIIGPPPQEVDLYNR
jgi:hypothetical protein